MKLSLFYPVYPYSLNQKFGENKPCVRNYGTTFQDIVMGVDDTTCPVGYEKLYPHLGLPKGHDGVDLMAGEQLCFSSLEGTVTQVSLDFHRGLGVYVTSDQEYDMGLDKPYRVSLVYWHFKENKIKVGDKVKVGDILGITDSTGASSGNHLHFEVIPVFLDAHQRLKNALQNDFRGAMDPLPFFNGQYARKYQFTKDLYFGLTDPDVRELQKLLGVTPVTGFFGPRTFSAVRQFQQSHGITSTGFWGSKSRAVANS